MLNKNAFGQLIRSYRKRLEWSQEELAERWGHTRSYVSQVEGGKRKLDSTQQLVRLADILDIPQEKLEAIGRGIPQRKINVVSSKEADNAILQMLLAPGKDMVRLAYMIWLADEHTDIEIEIAELITILDEALTAYHGEFVQPAQDLLAHAPSPVDRSVRQVGPSMREDSVNGVMSCHESAPQGVSTSLNTTLKCLRFVETHMDDQGRRSVLGIFPSPPKVTQASSLANNISILHPSQDSSRRSEKRF